MRQDSNREPYVPWGEPVRRADPVTRWTRLATVPALVKHVVVMFTTMALVTTINLIVNPSTWWSLALLVIWVAVVIIHGLGGISIGVLLDEDEPRPAPLPKAEARSKGVTTSSWAPRQPDEQRADTPARQERQDEILSAWPEAPSHRQPPREEPAAEHGSWRAVTDIAWLRQSRNGSDNGVSEKPAVARDREASS
jgi:hypothetical protein